MFNTIEATSNYLCIDDLIRAKAMLDRSYAPPVGCAPTPVDCMGRVMKRKPIYEKYSNKTNNMEDTMNTNINVTPQISMTDNNLASARTALSNRLLNLRNAKEHDLMKAYFIVTDEAPETKEELIARITEGKFEVAKRFLDATGKISDEYDYMSIWDMIEWRSQPADKVGYKAAIDKLTDAYKDADLIIDVCDPATKGLETVTAFKAATFN